MFFFKFCTHFVNLLISIYFGGNFILEPKGKTGIMSIDVKINKNEIAATKVF